MNKLKFSDDGFTYNFLRINVQEMCTFKKPKVFFVVDCLRNILLSNNGFTIFILHTSHLLNISYHGSFLKLTIV